MLTGVHPALDPNRSACGRCTVRTEDQAHADRPGLEARLGQRTTGVQAGELAGLEVVRRDETRLALRPLRALRRAAQHGCRARALGAQIGQGLHAVLCRRTRWWSRTRSPPARSAWLPVGHLEARHHVGDRAQADAVRPAGRVAQPPGIGGGGRLRRRRPGDPAAGGDRGTRWPRLPTTNRLA